MKSLALVALALLSATVALADVVAPPPPPPPEVPPPEAPAEPETPVGPQTYALDVKKSSFVMQVYKAGAASGLAHDHVIHATSVSGSVVVDVADLGTAKVEVTVQTKGLVNDDPKMRKRYGLEGELPEKDRKAILDNMQNAEQLDVANFPTITFSSTSVTPAGAGKATINGTLTIKGKSQPISMPATIVFKGKAVEGKGSVRLKFTSFGIEPYSAFFGAVRNQDDITLHVRLVANAS